MKTVVCHPQATAEIPAELRRSALLYVSRWVPRGKYLVLRRVELKKFKRRERQAEREERHG